jgi:putative ABC transport system permease protein
MKTLKLSWLLLRRDLRAGECTVLLIALILAVGSISTVGLFADRVRVALQQEATSLLGADLRVSSTRRLPTSYRDAARERGLRTVETASFPSMVTGQQESALAEILAVGDGYPLRGKIVVDDGSTYIAPAIPKPGTIWGDERLMQRLGLQLSDEVGIGSLHLRLAARVVQDVDQSVGFASFAPRVIMNYVDLRDSGLVQEGSRINYRLLVAGEAKRLESLRSWLNGQRELGEKVEDVRDARPEIRTALDRAEHFLALAALTSVVLAGVALGLASRRFVSRHLDSCAMMRCLGAEQAQVLRIFLLQFLLLGAFAVLLGEVLGYLAQAALVESIASMRKSSLPAPGWTPVCQAAVSGIALLLGFAFLPLWRLRRVLPLRVIRRELGAPEASTSLLYATGGAVLCGLFLWQAGSMKLGLAVLGGLVSGLLIFGMLAWLVLRALPTLPGRPYLVLANLARHGRGNAVQTAALSLGGMALLLLTFVRSDLIDTWYSRLPPETPNRFIVNIQPDQRANVLAFFVRQKLPVPDLFPMVRGRLVGINGQAIHGDDYADPRARGLVEREFNLSSSATLPAGNQLAEGQWWANDATPALSVEEGIAKTLGIRVGDVLTYDVAGSRFSAKVVNLRSLEWDSMRVNFFVIAKPGVLEGFPTSFITSFHLPEDRRQAMNALIKAFPNLLLIDVQAMIEEVRHIMDDISQTMSAVFMFTLSSGLAVLYAALLATQDERTREAAILRTLGADSHYLRRLHLGEFAMLGLLSGLFSAAGAVLMGWVLARFVIDIPYRSGIGIWLVGALGGVSSVVAAGWLGTRRLTMVPPLVILRE